MANWTQQLREAYRALVEGELLTGQAARRRQKELADQGKELAVKAVRRVERIGGFEPPNETEDITSRVARELLNAPHPAGTIRNPATVQGPRRAIKGSREEREEMAGLEQAQKIVDELAAERAARLEAARKNITEAKLIKLVRGREAAKLRSEQSGKRLPTPEEVKAAEERMAREKEKESVGILKIDEDIGHPDAYKNRVARLKDMIAAAHADPHITFFGAQQAHNATQQLMQFGEKYHGNPHHHFGELKPFVLRKPWADEGTTIDEQNDPKNLPMDVLRHHAATKANQGKPLTPEQRNLARQHVLLKAAEQAKNIK